MSFCLSYSLTYLLHFPSKTTKKVANKSSWFEITFNQIELWSSARCYSKVKRAHAHKKITFSKF